jgi:hypothetical protein
MWNLWGVFCIVPFSFEIAIIAEAFAFNKKVDLNAQGLKRA